MFHAQNGSRIPAKYELITVHSMPGGGQNPFNKIWITKNNLSLVYPDALPQPCTGCSISITCPLTGHSERNISFTLMNLDRVGKQSYYLKTKD